MGDPTETLGMDWSHSLQASQQYYTTGSRRHRSGIQLEILIQDLNTWRNHGGGLYMPLAGGAMKALFDWLIANDEKINDFRICASNTTSKWYADGAVL